MLEKTVDELIHIAAAGGGFTVDSATCSIEDLARIAAAAAGTGARLVITRAGPLATDELVRIANAGRGAVVFE